MTTREVVELVLESSVRTAIAAALVGLCLWAFRVRSSQVRHVAWVAVLAVMVAMPVLLTVMPVAPVPMPEQVEPFVAELAVPDTSAPVAMRVSENPPAVVMQELDWVSALAWIYAAVVVGQVARLLIGWFFVYRLRHGSRRVPELGAVYETARVKVPMTVGLLRPVVLLPLEWRWWTVARRDAILAHEFAHVRRRDGLVLFLAAWNRCVFWFHPVAWFLQTQLAQLAEEVCDDAGATAAGNRAAYAETLLTMASGMRFAPGRIAFGEGGVAARIERVLANPVHGSRWLLYAAGLACVFSLAGAVACGVKPEVTKTKGSPVSRLARRLEMEQKSRSVDMTGEQARQLEESKPDDIQARSKLLMYYGGSGAVGMEGRRRQILWFIEHHPEAQIAEGTAQLLTSVLADPVGYHAARKLWLAKVADANTPANVMLKAGHFFAVLEGDIAEGAYQKAKASRDLGRLYGYAMFPVWSIPNVAAFAAPQRLSANEGAEAVKKMESTQDVEVLLGAAFALRPRPLNGRRLGFDPMARSLAYSQRALKLDPTGFTTNSNYLEIRKLMEEKAPAILGKYGLPGSPTLDQVLSMPENDRFRYLLQAAEQIISKPRAEELLRLAMKAPTSDEAETAKFRAHISLGFAALVAKDQKEATAQLLAAAETRGSDRLRYRPINHEFAQLLLDRGERSAVATYLEKLSRITMDARTKTWAAAIRKGETPRITSTSIQVHI